MVEGGHISQPGRQPGDRSTSGWLLAGTRHESGATACSLPGRGGLRRTACSLPGRRGLRGVAGERREHVLIRADHDDRNPRREPPDNPAQHRFAGDAGPRLVLAEPTRPPPGQHDRGHVPAFAAHALSTVPPGIIWPTGQPQVAAAATAGGGSYE